jgi:hypothetical protein
MLLRRGSCQRRLTEGVSSPALEISGRRRFGV